MRATQRLANSKANWWRHAVVYQIYPRSFADGNGDGVGDIPGIVERLPAIADLGVDAIWLSPFYTSPQKDAGYDVADYCDIDPIFGTLHDAQTLISTAHELGLRVIVDIVPNHSSSQHPWFQEALASRPGSKERSRYIFRDGKGKKGELPPNNWHSVFGGPAWTRTTNSDGSFGQWYLHLFDSSQPDLNWENTEIWDLFRGILRFWLARGVDGFRVDVAHGLIKEKGLPDRAFVKNPPLGDRGPHWDQERVHEIYRDWRTVLESYGSDKMMCAEAWVWPLAQMARYVRSDEMHQAFNFGYLATPWNADALRSVIRESLEAFGGVGAPATWVLSNHDVVRHASRFGLRDSSEAHLHGIGPQSAEKPDEILGLKIARAATTLMLALPGSAYLFQGEELGLPEVIEIRDDQRDDPTFFRTEGKRYGRDGCRVPIPWEKDKPAYGFSLTGTSWLPQPTIFASLARNMQEGKAGSTLELYKSLLSARAEFVLGEGTIEWLEENSSEVVAFQNGSIAVTANTGDRSVPLPPGELLIASGELEGDSLPSDTAAWVKIRT